MTDHDGCQALAMGSRDLPAGCGGGGGLVGAARPAAGAEAAKDPAAAGAMAAVPQEAIPTRDFWRIVQDAGPLMIAIAGCSLLLVTFVLERAISLRRGRVIPKPFVTRFLQQIGRRRTGPQRGPGPLPEKRQPDRPGLRRGGPQMGPAGVEVEQAVIDSGERVTNSSAPLSPRVLRRHHRRAAAGPDGHRAGNDPDLQRDRRRTTPWAAPNCWPAASPRPC